MFSTRAFQESSTERRESKWLALITAFTVCEMNIEMEKEIFVTFKNGKVIKMILKGVGHYYQCCHWPNS